MKRVLFVSIMVLATMIVQAKEVFSFGNLKPGDLFCLKITLPFGDAKPGSVWDFNSVQKIDIDFKVLAVNKDSVRLGIKPTNWYICSPNLIYPEVLRQHGVRVNYYFDSQYHTFLNSKPIFYLFDNNSVNAFIHAQNGGMEFRFTELAEEQLTSRSRKRWSTDLREIPEGLDMVYWDGKLGNYTLDFESTIKLILDAFLKEWKKSREAGQSIPWLVDLSSGFKEGAVAPVYIQLTAASFSLPSNSFISLTTPAEMPEDRVFITMGDQRILPSKKEGDAYLFDLFLSSPQRFSIGNVLLDMTPADSLVVKFNAYTRQYEFSGKGWENSAYTNSIVSLYKDETADMTHEKEQELFFSKGKAFFESILSRYAPAMNPYWLHSAKLSFDYWYAAERIRLYNEKVKQNRGRTYPDENEIPWKNEHFTRLFPFSDYLYQPYTYGNLMKAFLDFKARQNYMNTLTSVGYLQGGARRYYFADVIFWGYPGFYLTGDALAYQMVRFGLHESSREYEDFTRKCPVPELRDPIIALHDKLAKAAPGANIKALNLEVEKQIPLKHTANGYVILLVKERLDNNPEDPLFEERLRLIRDEIEKTGLKGSVEVCIITGESQKATFAAKPGLQQQIYFAPEKSIRDYEDKIISDNEAFLIIRNDGTIIDKRLGSKHMNSHRFILIAIQADIEAQRAKGSTQGEVFITIALVLVAVLVTFFTVRYAIVRREKTKRKLQELELKAIRAQMNPHFTFNALGSIQNLIAQKKEKEANEYLVNFSKLLRTVLSSSEKKLVPLSDEILLLELYLHMEQLRVPFEYRVQVDEQINTETEEIPGMLIQPIVENAVKHGVVPKGGGEIGLSFTLQNGVMQVVVTDSGDGFTAPADKPLTGFGLKSVRERLALLNKELHLDIRLHLENREENGVVKGCKATLTIPV